MDIDEPDARKVQSGGNSSGDGVRDIMEFQVEEDPRAQLRHLSDTLGTRCGK
jgi:hypothetical protein